MFLLTAPSAALTGLTYVGPATDQGIAVLQFTLTGADLTGMVITGACTSGHAVRVSVPPSATAVVTSSTFYAVSIAFTYGPASFVFTPSAPPPDSFALAGGTVTQLGLEGTTLSSSGLVLHSPTTAAISC